MKIARDPIFEEIKLLCRPSAKTQSQIVNTNNNQSKVNYMINNISSSNKYFKNPDNGLAVNSFLKKQQQNLMKNSLRHKEKGLKIKVKKNTDKNDNKNNTSNMEIDDKLDSVKKADNYKDINLD